jgi:phenol hydroxylase P0 protein
VSLPETEKEENVVTRKSPAAESGARFDPTRKYVRVTNVNRQGFVEFEFSIGSPELCVELMLRPEAFEEFCRTQGVIALDDLSRQ